MDQVVYRAEYGSSGTIWAVASSLADQTLGESWRQRLDPWLRTGTPLGRCYLNFGPQAALIRWHPDTGSQRGWQYAHVLIGPADVLTSGYALELPELSMDQPLARAGLLLRVSRSALGHDYGSIRARVRSGEVTDLLVPLLARVLAGEQSITMPWTGPWLPEAAMWGLTSILNILGDTQPVSFLTYAAGQPASSPGLFVSFRAGATSLPPDPGHETLAAELVARFASDPARLRRTIRRSGAPTPGGRASHLAQILSPVADTPAVSTPAAPAAQTTNARSGETIMMDANVPGPVIVTAPPAPRGEPVPAAGPAVTCPICLHDITGWESLPYWHWDPDVERYVERPIPPDLNPNQRDHYRRGAYVRCPAAGTGPQGEHYLPVNYGLFGPPVLLGFIGLTRSGKSHLLASMVGAMETGGLHEYGITSRPVDQVLHRRFMDTWVNPLFHQDKVLPGTQEGIVTFADAFLIRRGQGPERTVALFDVAGGDLARPEETKHFLEITNGLIFVVDPDHLDAQRLGDETFSNVLSVVAEKKRSTQVSAAIVLNKADKLRFEPALTRWLRTAGGDLDPDEFLLESADVYAYLQQHQGAALTSPYRECSRATLHVASPTGGPSDGQGEGGVYPRGVRPKRVLRPLVAMLAMTGVLAGPEIQRVGI